ncbi:uncharacterized protein RJT21DRAFT_132771 [Scheffersomyces amazonensis]|uniref:uncharacterized protein n=1 Tax=Scheffersomyces amazonensis TaxID=1078765 RepID=UPI00315D3842
MQNPFLISNNITPTTPPPESRNGWKSKFLKTAKSHIRHNHSPPYSPPFPAPIPMEDTSPRTTPISTPAIHTHTHTHTHIKTNSATSSPASSVTSVITSPFETPQPSSFSTSHNNHSYSHTPPTDPEFSGKNGENSTPKSKAFFAPKVKPYIISQQTSNNSSISRGNEVCTICEESIQSRLEFEKTLTLSCGDMIHEECFQVTLECEVERLMSKNILNSNSTVTDVEHNIMFQYCKGPNCMKKGTKKQIILQDKQLYHHNIHKCLTNYRSKHVKIQSPNVKALSSTLRGSKIQAKDFSNPNAIHSPIPIRAKDAPGRYSIFNTISSPPKSFATQVYPPQPQPLSRSPSPNPSIATIDTSIAIQNHKSVQLDDLRNHFIKYLLESYPNFNLSSLITFGSLRLVDKLRVAIDPPSSSNVNNFQVKTVYLFQNVILIWSQNSPSLYFTLDNIHIQTPQPSILKISLKDSEIYLSSDIGAIIEKWVIGMSDLKFSFPPEILTSTIPMPSKTLDPKMISNKIKEPMHHHTIKEIDNVNDNDNDKDNDLDFDSDDELIKAELNRKSSIMNNSRIDSIFQKSTINDEYDSDEDSDQEVIDKYKPKDDNAWNEIISHIDNAISTNFY